jgi:hypothetical protein
MDPLFFGLIALVFIVVVVAGAIYSKKRHDAMKHLAAELGFQHDARSSDVHSRFERFQPLNVGRSRRSKNHLHGRRREIEWNIFDYQYRTGSGKNAKTHSIGVIAAAVPVQLPAMQVRPENMFDRLAAMAGFDDINFESEQFSRRYHVSSNNRRACYEVIHPQMMEYLLAMPDANWQLSGREIALIRNGFYPVDEIEPTMRMIEGFVARIPQHVRTGGGP